LSTKKNRPFRVFLLAVVTIILYFALFPYPAGKELVARPAWAVPLPAVIPAAPAGADAGKAAAPFQLGDVFGYVNDEGAFLSVDRTAFRVSLSQNGFVTYSRVGNTWFLQDPRGRRQYAFSGDGYPMLSADGSRLFTVKTDLSGLTELDRSGSPVWSRDFPSLMTGVSIGTDGLAIGLLSGEVDLVDRQGKLVFSAPSQGSRIPAVMGVALSPDEALLATVGGVDPQLLTVLERRGPSTYQSISDTPTGTDFRREVRMGFDPSGSYLYYEGREGVGLWDARGRRAALVPLPRGLAAAAFLPVQGLAVFIGGDQARRELLVVKPFASVRIRESFPAGSLYAGTIGDGLLLGLDGLLLRIDLEVM
jgi:hypothetical protein